MSLLKAASSSGVMYNLKLARYIDVIESHAYSFVWGSVFSFATFIAFESFRGPDGCNNTQLATIEVGHMFTVVFQVVYGAATVCLSWLPLVMGGVWLIAY